MERWRADSIADTLEEEILGGLHSDGDRLDEIRIAARFGVSRTPVREALQRLARSGLAEHLPRRGVFVRQPGPVQLMEMFEVMAELEAVCARLAAVRISDAALDELRSINTRCQSAISGQDTDGYYRENERFHQLIYIQSGNSFLAEECQRLQRRLRPFRRVQLRLRGRMRQSMAEHEAILAALDAGNGPLAGEAIHHHVAVQGEKFHHLMASLRAAE